MAASFSTTEVSQYTARITSENVGDGISTGGGGGRGRGIASVLWGITSVNVEEQLQQSGEIRWIASVHEVGQHQYMRWDIIST